MTFVCIHVFFLLWRVEPPEWFIQPGGDTLPSSCRIVRAKSCSSHCCDANISGKLSYDFSTYFRFLEVIFLENLMQILN